MSERYQVSRDQRRTRGAQTYNPTQYDREARVAHHHSNCRRFTCPCGIRYESWRSPEGEVTDYIVCACGWQHYQG